MMGNSEFARKKGNKRDWKYKALYDDEEDGDEVDDLLALWTTVPSGLTDD